MIEIPESTTLSRQLNEQIRGKIISYVQAGKVPHAFAFYFGDPAGYDELLSGKTIGESIPRGAMIEIQAEDCRIVLGDGTNLRYYDNLKKVPARHQLYIEFDDQTALVCTIAMYGGIWAYKEEQNDNPYYLVTLEKPWPLSDAFNLTYFRTLRTPDTDKLSAKAFLATKQRIPGLGNGTLQDILFTAGIHPKTKMSELSEEQYDKLYHAVKDTLTQMTEQGGRDTEKDLYGKAGNYPCILSKNTLWTPCPECGYEIHKSAYLGGTIYFCEHCQPLRSK